MLTRRALIPVFVLSNLFLGACSSTTSSDSESENAETDRTQRASMRSEVEGLWTGSFTFTDGRAATTMTLELRYNGNDQTTIKCGNRTLATDVQPACVTLYTMPLSGTLTTADGTRKSEPVTLSYGNLDGLAGAVSAGNLEGGIQNGKLEGNITGTNGGAFSLARAGR